jgi:hypothetical protein
MAAKNRMNLIGMPALPPPSQYIKMYDRLVVRRRHSPWPRRLALSAVCLALVPLYGEIAFRSLGFINRVCDLQRIRFSYGVRKLFTRIEGSVVMRPDASIAGRACGTAIRFTTRPCPDARVGFRSNGSSADGGPPFGVVLGDSLTEGAHVDDEQTFVSVLSRSTGKRFVNLGAAAEGVSGHLERLRLSALLSQRPRVVILQLHETDLEDEAWSAVVSDAARRSQPIYFQRYASWPVWFPERLWMMLLTRSVFWVFAERAIVEPYLARSELAVLDAPAASLMGKRRMRRSLEQAVRQMRAVGAKILIVEYRIDVSRFFKLRPQEHDVALLRLDLSDELRLWRDEHWRPEGHAEVARLIGSKLKDLGWL